MKSIGKYDQRVSFMQMQQVDDGYGGTTSTLVEVISTFARVEGVSTHTAIEQFQQKDGQLKRFYIRYRKEFYPDNTMLIRYKGNDFTITTPELVDSERISLEWQMIGTYGSGNS